MTSCITSSNHGIVHDGNFLFLGAVPPEPLLSARSPLQFDAAGAHALVQFRHVWYNWRSPGKRRAEAAVTADWMAHHVLKKNCSSLFAYHAMRDTRHFDPRSYSFARRRVVPWLPRFGSVSVRSDAL